MIPATGLRPNVTGSSRLMPASGPTPGSIPTRVPMTHPAKANIRIDGVSPTENPISKFCNASCMARSKAPRTARQLHVQQIEKHEICNEREPDGRQEDIDDGLAFDHTEEEYEQRYERQAIAERLEHQHGDTASRPDQDGARSFSPPDGLDRQGRAAKPGDQDADQRQCQAEQERQETPPPFGQGADRIGEIL